MAWITKRGSSWQYVVRYKDENGKYQRIPRSGFARKKDAQDAAAELERQIKEGGVVDKQPTIIIGLKLISSESTQKSLSKGIRVLENTSKDISGLIENLKILKDQIGKNL